MFPATSLFCQFRSRRARNMLCLSLFLVLLTTPIWTYVTETPSFIDRLGKLYEKLEKITIAPTPDNFGSNSKDKLYAKLERFNALSPDKFELSDEEEELISTMEKWGLSADQMDIIVKELQRTREDDEEKIERNEEYNDEDELLKDLSEGDYLNDKDWETEDEVTFSTSKPLLGTMPSAFTKTTYKKTIISAAEPIALTNERPRILDETSLTKLGTQLRQEAFANAAKFIRESRCHTPQARWLTVRQMAPAADTNYMPSCVRLHRCTPDSGCCTNDADICAPIEGKYVALPFYLHKADGNTNVARMVFYNHTKCACVSRETLQTTIRTRIESKPEPEPRRDLAIESQNDWRMPTEAPKLDSEEPTAPPQLRRCTCPTLFLSTPENGSCSCICDWPEAARRRDCLSLARGKEHFGLRDRVCVAQGHCNQPSCEYGSYDKTNGICPLRRFRRLRFHRVRPQPEKTMVV
ncbi:uncharacterized protein LOC101742944 [Bombyx mori]|uniref:Platelet-derived growth factor (PDGF) family profile domain-containing protein n=1 Tax=Bombyx mori TaxID=7091 RepID=A0A8R2ASF8_BOMMO|nr:uncharacterized protein LOC101742944 [Bombyx mori]